MDNLKKSAGKLIKNIKTTSSNIYKSKQVTEIIAEFNQSISNPYLRNYADILLRRRNTIMVFFSTVVVLVGLGSFIMQPVYRATSTLLIDIESPNVLSTSSGSGSVMGSTDYYAYKEYLQSQIEIIVSRPIGRDVFNELGLANTREYRGARDPIKNFLKKISVEPVRDTRLLKLNAENRDPVLAAKMANLMAETYVMRNLAYISKNELLNLLKNEYLKLQTKLSEFSKIYKEEHPDMIRLKREIADLVKRIHQENAATSSFDLSRNPPVDASQDVFRGLKANNVSIIASADVPVNRIRPKRILNIFIAIIVGMLGGIGLAFMFEYLDDTIKGVEGVELTGANILGNVPAVVDPENKMTDKEKDTITQTRPRDPISEAFRSFRTNISLLSTQERPIRSLLITSPGPSEGKTFTSVNLGIVLAQNKKRVLLVDADMRKPRLNTVLDKDNKIGLSNFLSNQVGFEKIIQETNIENLSFVSGGLIPPDPSELLDTQKMKEFLALAGAKFDFVLIDTPPVAILADAIILSRLVDGVVMVAEVGKTSRNAFTRVCKILKEAKVRLLGVFLNKVSINSSDHYYYSAYYSHYSLPQDNSSKA
jgi:capsular exopolysaccharide synthesis family protein